MILFPRTHPEFSLELDLSYSCYIKMHDCPVLMTKENREIYLCCLKLLAICLDNILFFGQKYFYRIY